MICSRPLKRVGSTAALALALAAAPLAAQTEQPAKPTQDVETSPEEAAAVAPFELVVLGGDDRSVAEHPLGQGLPHDQSVCLEALEFLVVSAAGEEIVYAAPGCLEPRAGLGIPDEVYAGSHVWRPLEGPASAAAANTASEASSRRARIGAVRSAGPAPAAERLIATRGTAGALRKFPRGTLIGSARRICLAAGDRLTVARRSGGRSTYGGPGCGRRVGTADDNAPAVSPG